MLRALGWGATAFVGGCCPAWLFAHLDNKAYARAVFTGLVGIVCAAVTIGGSIAGISGSGDKYAAERAKVAGQHERCPCRAGGRTARAPGDDIHPG